MSSGFISFSNIALLRIELMEELLDSFLLNESTTTGTHTSCIHPLIEKRRRSECNFYVHNWTNFVDSRRIVNDRYKMGGFPCCWSSPQAGTGRTTGDRQHVQKQRGSFHFKRWKKIFVHLTRTHATNSHPKQIQQHKCLSITSLIYWPFPRRQ